ncbi:TIGR02099 family protein [bacterium BD-1]|nr:TIGR02099 family protein [Ottowia caeni]
MVQSYIKAAAISIRWVLRGACVVLILLLIAWGALHWFIVPRIDEFRPRLERIASRMADAPVSIGVVKAQSNGFVPTVSFHDVRVHDPSGRPGLVVPHMLAAFSVLSLGKGELEQLVIDGVEVELRHTQDGRLLVGGIDSTGDSSSDEAVADWVFSQPEVLVQNGRVRWVDERRSVPPVVLSGVQFVVRNGFGRHQLRLDATPESSWGDRFTLIGQFRQSVFAFHPGRWRDWGGQVFADLGRANVSQLRQYLDLKDDWGLDIQAGEGALRFWADVEKGRVTGATADVALRTVSATFGPNLAPLAFASLTGRIGWRSPGAGAGMELSTRDLQFVDADGLSWPGGNVQLHYRDGTGSEPAGGEFTGDRLDLAALAKIAQRLPLPPAVSQRLAEHPVQGLVERIEARWDGQPDAPKDWRLQTKVRGLAVGALPAAPRQDGVPVEGVPGIDGADLELQATPAGGTLSLQVKNGALEFPGVFAEPRIPLTEFKAVSRWQVKNGQIAIDLDQLALRNQDLTGTFRGRWTTLAGKTEADRYPGVLDLTGTFSRANGARVHRYLPLGIPAEAREYVRHAIQKGEARNVAVRVKGDLNQVGNKIPEPGSLFRFAGQVRGVTMAYVPRHLQPEGQAPWPALEDLSGELIFDHNTMQVKNASGGVQGHPGWRFTRVQAGIADLGHTRVLVEAEGRGALTSALGIVNASPVGGFIQHALDRATASGDAGLLLKLDLPVENIDNAKVEGSVSLMGNDLSITPEVPRLAQAHGAVVFSEAGFAVRDARAGVLGGEVRLSGGTQTGERAGYTVLNATGTASAQALREMTDWAPLPGVAASATGSAGYEARIEFHAGEPQVLVTSDLRGMAFDLPAPLDKPAGAAWPLRYASGPAAGAEGRTRLELTVADRLAVEYEREAQSGQVLRGAIRVGSQAAQKQELPGSGVAAHVKLPRLDASAWDTALARMFSSESATPSGNTADKPSQPKSLAESGFIPRVWTLNTGALLLDERTVHDVSVNGTRDGSTWHADVQARELAGRLSYTEGADGRAGKLVARLSRLSIPAGAEDQTVLSQPPAHMPALDIVAENFELRGKKLGRLEVNAVNHDVAPARQAGALQAWELTRLALHVPEAVFMATGRWDVLARAPALPLDPRAPRAPEDPRRTRLEFKLDIRDAGALLTRFDMPGVLARGEGELRGDLSWRGAPMSPHYPSMGGQLHLDVGAGQFLKADPGAAKLLGVLSLQALPRRLTLDFRDLFSTGFAFDFVRGDVTVAQGVAHTNNLQMKGVNAAVLMDGRADIDKETQDLRVVVVPEIDTGTAALVATAINPAVGLGAFLAQLVLKRPLIKANTQEFHVDGSWDNPAVHKLDSSAQRGASPGKDKP